MKKFYDPRSLVYILSHLLVLAVGVSLSISDKILLAAIGTSLIATGMAGLVIFTYVFASNRLSESLAAVLDFGIVKVFEGRQVKIKSEYDQLLDRARDRIDIMGFGLEALRKDYLDDFAVWKQKAHIRVLLIDPEYPNADASHATQRDLEEGDAPGTIVQQVHRFIAETKNITQMPGKGSFQIRLYRCLPAVNIFRVDNQMFWGPYLIKQPSRNSPTFLVRNALLFDRLLKHFDQIWADDSLSRPIPEDW